MNVPNDGYLWKISNSERLQTWPSESRIRYLSKATEFMPKRFINKKGIDAPPKALPDIPAKFGIEAAAFAAHRKGFYIMREEKHTHELIFVLRGIYRARTDAGDFKVSSGMFFVLPVNAPCRDSVGGRGADILWFRLAAKSAWRKTVGSVPLCRKSKHIEKIAFLAEMYADEARSNTPSVSYLRDIMCVLTETLRREFSSDKSESDRAKADEIRALVDKNPSKRWTLLVTAKKTGNSTAKLNAIFESSFGMSFSKTVRGIKMSSVAEMLMGGKTLRFCAKAAGYADAYSLSNAFKSHFGLSPKKFLQQAAVKTEQKQKKHPLNARARPL